MRHSYSIGHTNEIVQLPSINIRINIHTETNFKVRVIPDIPLMVDESIRENLLLAAGDDTETRQQRDSF